jgi:glycoprotein endo-alpha-1,2-mannosidase
VHLLTVTKMLPRERLYLSLLFPSFLLLFFGTLSFASASSSPPQNKSYSPLSLFPSPSLHIFFYAWYGAPPTDVGYLHWTHSVLPHWQQDITDMHRKEPYIAPGDPGVSFYPSRGLYSSRDPVILDVQMAEMRSMQVDVVVVSWWGAKHKNNSIDGQGVGSDHCIPVILDAAAKHNLSVAFHLEPYPLRSEYSVKDDLQYIWQQYGSHPAFYRHPVTGQCLVYAYDSYHMTTAQWQKLLLPGTSMSIRGTEHDCIVIGLVLDDMTYLTASGFDGAYSYFAAEAFTRAATPSLWPQYNATAAAADLLFIPCIGPGYDDTRLRPWNRVNIKHREKGKYYNRMWSAAVNLSVPVVAVTSYNEWGEGTQIEPARPFRTDKDELLKGYNEKADGGKPDNGDLRYVNATRRWARTWRAQWMTQRNVHGGPAAAAAAKAAEAAEAEAEAAEVEEEESIAPTHAELR